MPWSSGCIFRGTPVKSNEQNIHRQSAGNCPRCASHKWQSLRLAHQQAVRTAESGYETVSKLGERVAPPERRSLIIGPLVTGLWLASGAWLALMFLLPDSWNSDTWFNPGRLLIVVAAFLIGGAVQLALSLRFNAREWPRLAKIWRAARVCRRCGEIFLPDD